MAFAQLEQVGEPVKLDPEDAARRARQAKREKFEAGMRELKKKRG